MTPVKKFLLAFFVAVISIIIIMIIVNMLFDGKYKTPKLVPKTVDNNVNHINDMIENYEMRSIYPITDYDFEKNEVIDNYNETPKASEYVTIELILNNNNYNVYFAGYWFDGKTVKLDGNWSSLNDLLQKDKKVYIPSNNYSILLFKGQIAELIVQPKTNDENLIPERKVYYKLPKKINPDQMVQIVIDENGKIH